MFEHFYKKNKKKDVLSKIKEVNENDKLQRSSGRSKKTI
jgi:hypothetical protein